MFFHIRIIIFLSNNITKMTITIKLKVILVVTYTSMNLYDMEGNSRMENLVAFKIAYADALRSVSCCLEKFFPRMTVSDIQEFLYAFFPFLFGVYPYTTATDKQYG